jgi:beta-galactosidase
LRFQNAWGSWSSFHLSLNSIFLNLFRILDFGFWIPGSVAGIVLCLSTAISLLAYENPVASFCDQWRFHLSDVQQAQACTFDDTSWETVTLPHTAHVEALIAGQRARQWQGICWYRKSFELPASVADKEIVLRFEGAMNAAEIWVNGQSAGKFMGGYLPYVMDISKLAHPGATNVVAVRLDNRDNPMTGPKPLADLDFNLYGGLYRDARLIIKNKLHITDSILANKTASGGTFVTFPSVSKAQAVVNVRTHVQNDSAQSRTSGLRTTLLDIGGAVVGTTSSVPVEVPAGTARQFVQSITVTNPKLWSPKSPSLYVLRTELLEGDRTIDSEQTRIGIRRLHIDKDGFTLNGEKMLLRGANRHQEYPYLGNAVPDAAQYRDALKLKQAGFDYVRLSHYPQSPAFLDACDELGIVVMDSIMGWQYFGKDPGFARLKLEECRQLIRRDRNHPCVALWEVSLNESDMPKSFVAEANAVAHEEYPGDQCYTSGWVDGYDVFMQARQHGGCHKVRNRPCLVSEYGDWEYFAQNAGLEQDQWKNLQPAERNSRQLRGDGELRLLQQALNFQEAHNDDLSTSAFADGIWVVFDYNRGYAPDLESSGVMDIFRIPKFSYWFFRTQRDAQELVAGAPIGPTVFIANYWTPESPLEIRVFSNCEEVGLYVNQTLIERRHPDTGRVATNLRHPPFTFKLGQFRPGTLRVVGYIGGREVASSERHTPGEVTQLSLHWDTSGKPFAAGEKDAIFCYADLQDAAGTVVPTARVPVFFGATGQADLVGHNPILSEAGTAAILLQSKTAQPLCSLFALALLKEDDQTRVLSAAISPNGESPARYKLYYTTDGSQPTITSPEYLGPVKSTSHLRAALIVGGKTVALADSRSSAASTCDKPTAVEQAASQ